MIAFNVYFDLFFRSGFVLDGFKEPRFSRKRKMTALLIGMTFRPSRSSGFGNIIHGNSYRKMMERRSGGRILERRSALDDETGAVIRKIEDEVREALFRDGAWHIDYRRLRVMVSKA